MNNGHAADVTVHVSEELDSTQRASMESGLKTIDGVLSVHLGDGPAAHLVIVAYDPELTHSEDLLNTVSGQGLHGALIGF